MKTKQQTPVDWYRIDNVNEIDSPALIVYKERVRQNIATAISMIGDVNKLRPHVKTNKSSDASQLMIDAGITKFKCATIAEAEMLATLSAPDVLLAYQPVGPKLSRFISLIRKYPHTKFSCLIDNIESAKNISNAAAENNIKFSMYIDINIGMNRTGIAQNKVVELYLECKRLQDIEVEGLHVYDGHIRSENFDQRTIDCNNAYEKVADIQNYLIYKGFEVKIIAGGSPTFPIHAKRNEAECSPGTFIYWDNNYSQSCAEQKFIPAALVIARIISLPDETKLCIDLGHKSIASENELNKRVFFLNAPELRFISHSEEHLVAEANEHHNYKTGYILYGLPYHICPTVALYERALVVENNEVTSEWKTIARDRMITI